MSIKPVAILRNQPILPYKCTAGRGHISFPEFLELEVYTDDEDGDCFVYPDSPDNRKRLVRAKCRYNRYTTGPFAGRHFVHRYEIMHGEPVIVIQRIL